MEERARAPLLLVLASNEWKGPGQGEVAGSDPVAAPRAEAASSGLLLSPRPPGQGFCASRGPGWQRNGQQSAAEALVGPLVLGVKSRPSGMTSDAAAGRMGGSMISLLRSNRSSRRLFVAHAVSRAGDAFNTVALVILVYRLTGSGLGVAATVAFEVAPVLLLGPVAGVVADRFPRRSVMLAADLARTLLAAALAFAHGTPALAYAVAFGLSTGALAFNPAASSLLPEVVEADELVAANSLCGPSPLPRRSCSPRWPGF